MSLIDIVKGQNTDRIIQKAPEIPEFLPKTKQRLASQRIENELREFLAKGNKVDKLENNVFGVDYT